MPPETPLLNDPASRTPTGEIKDQSQTTSTEATSSTTPPEPKATEPPKTEEPKGEQKTEPKPEGDKSLLNQKDEPPAGAPEKYEPFTVPEGYELDEKVFEEASALFKDLGLNQEGAQRLVDYYAKRSIAAEEAGVQLVADMRKEWMDQVKADPELGSRLGDIRKNVGRMYDSLENPQLVAAFKEAMDLTGAGNHPAFVKLFDKLSQVLSEGGHVSGKGPSLAGQQAPDAKPASAAKALYPNLA